MRLADISIAAMFIMVAAIAGWVFAHGVIATECERLGGFYVGKTVYECRVKEVLP